MANAEQYADWLVKNEAKKGTPEFETVAQAYRQVRGQVAEPGAAESVGSALRELPRQTGLFARYAIEGPAQLASTITDPVGSLGDVAINAVSGGNHRTPTTAEQGVKLADWLGLPNPRNANERVVGDITRGGLSAGGIAGAARGAAKATEGGVRTALQTLAANPSTQVAAGAVGAGAGGSVREAGGGPTEQFLASLLGGVGGGYGANKLDDLIAAGKRGGAAVRNYFAAGRPQSELAASDQQINILLQRSGIDWSAVPERVRQGMREEVAAAIQGGGELDPAALRRLLAFRSTGTTPTVGMLTQNPGQITRERNLAKTSANSTDPQLQRLPNLENDNIRALLRRLDESGAQGAPDAMGAGRAAVGSLQGTARRAQGEIDSLYASARDTSGRSLPIDGHAFSTRANQLLDENNVGSFVPQDIANKMNAVAKGEIPLTVDVAEQLKTSIGNIQRGSADGNVRRALGFVRQALDEAPLQGSGGFGTQPAVAGSVPTSPLIAGRESIDAFNRARGANRTWMNRVESNPALRAVVDGVEPDQFVQRFVVGKGASAADVRSLAAELNPQAREAMRRHMVAHLKGAATNHTDDITKFSNQSYRDALRNIGEDKLLAFFTPDEVLNLRNVGQAAKYMQAQPAGSAVNNSNSGTFLLGRGVDLLNSYAGRVPMVGDWIQGTVQGLQQSASLAPRNGLLQAAMEREGPRLNSLLAAALAAPTQARGDDDRQRRP